MSNRRGGRLCVVAATIATALAGCGSASTTVTSTPTPPALPVSSAPLAGGTVPRELTCDGGDHQPPVSWGPLDVRTRAVVVEMLDPDAPGGTFTHWLQFRDGQPASAQDGEWVLGANDFGGVGYRGPCPPPGQTHHYVLTVIALAAPLGSGDNALHAGFRRADLERALQSRTAVGYGQIVATYRR